MTALGRIPPVTMGDLQSFQARHFIGSNITAGQDEDGDESDGDGLGYYADGVKRSLTDQQIEIFRHSEIQSILRKRRLKEEARLEDMGDDIVEEGTTFLAQEIRETDKAGKQLGPSESEKGGGEHFEGSKKKTKQHTESGAASITTLDYGGDTSTSVEFGTSSTQHHAMTLMGRKMVSYGDDDAET